MSEDEATLEALGTTPIRADAPTGDNIRYEAEFEQLEAELAKLESLSDETVDWQRVEQLAGDILARKSKDMLVAVYLAQALVENKAYPGLLTGLRIIRDLIDNYWDTMFPPAKRLRARASAMQWLAEKSAAFASAQIPQGSDEDALLQAYQVFRDIDGMLADKMGDKAPSLAELGRALKAHKQAIDFNREKKRTARHEKPQNQTTPSPAPAGEGRGVEERQAAPAASRPAPAPAKINKPATQTGQVVPGVIETEADARKMARQLQDMGRKLSSYWLQAKSSDPKPYRLNRVLAWMLIDRLPPAQDNITQINSPPAERRKRFASLFDQAQYPELIPELEQSLARLPFWLDGQRLVAASLQRMGESHQQAYDTVIAETAHFLSRLPGLVELKFADGTPFADEQTRLWLGAEVLAAKASPQPESSNKPQVSPWVAGLAKAQALAGKGSKAEAVEYLSRAAQEAATPRERFQWQCCLAELLIQLDESDIAMPLLEQLVDEGERDRLAYWEPQLLARAQQLLYRSCRSLSAKGKNGRAWEDKLQQAYAGLCRMDPALAFSTKGE